MAYQFDFGSLWEYRGVIADGVGLTIRLTAVGTVAGVGLGIAGAFARTSRSPALKAAVGAYVEFVRNTPFLIQLFFIFFGLPVLGVKLSEWQAASFAMVVNLSAYSTEIIRAGIQAVPKGQIEAAEALAMSRLQIFRHVILGPAMRKVWPALSSQIVIVMLGSSVCSQIAAEELTYAANFIQSRNFRAFEVYFVSTGLYLILAVGLRALLKLVGWSLFRRRRHV